jgi:hypothetical protein
MAAWAGGSSNAHQGNSRQGRQQNLQDFPPLQGDGSLSPTSSAKVNRGNPSGTNATSPQGHTKQRDDGSAPEVKQGWEEWEDQDWQTGAGGAAADNRAGNAGGAGAWAGADDDWDAEEGDGFGEDDDWFRPYQPQSLHQGSHYDQQGDTTGEGWVPDSTDPADTPLCPAWAAYASCPRGEECDLIHGDECEVGACCGSYKAGHRYRLQGRQDRSAVAVTSKAYVSELTNGRQCGPGHWLLGARQHAEGVCSSWQAHQHALAPLPCEIHLSLLVAGLQQAVVTPLQP